MIFSSQQSSQTRSTQTCSRWLLSMSCMILVECLIWIVHVQRVACKNCYPRPFSDVMVQSKDSYPIYRRMKMDKKKKFAILSLIIDGSCLTTHTFCGCSIATSMLRHVGASRLSSTYLTTFIKVMTDICGYERGWQGRKWIEYRWDQIIQRC